MKKCLVATLSLLVLVATLLTLAGCGAAATATPAPTQAAPTQAPAPTEAPAATAPPANPTTAPTPMEVPASTEATTVAPTATPAPQASGKKARITYWWWQAGPENQQLMDFAKQQFEAAQPDAEVEIRLMPNADYNTALKAAIAGGEAPDVFEIFLGAPLQELVKAEAVEDLTTRIDADKELQQWISAGMKVAEFSRLGKIYQVPMDLNFLSVWYWKDMLQEQGLQPPQSIDDLVAMTAKAQNAGLVPMAVGFKDQWSLADLFTILVHQQDNTHTMIDKAAKGEISWTDPVFVNAATAIKKMNDVGVFGKGAVGIAYYPDAWNTFKERKALMGFPHGNYISFDISPEEAAKDRIGVIPLPKINADAQAIYTGGQGVALGLYSKSKNPDLAWQFIRTLVSPEVQKKGLELVGRTPPGQPIDVPNVRPILKAMGEIQASNPIYYRYIDNPTANQAIIDALQSLFTGNSIDKALKGVDAAVKQ